MGKCGPIEQSIKKRALHQEDIPHTFISVSTTASAIQDCPQHKDLYRKAHKISVHLTFILSNLSLERKHVKKGTKRSSIILCFDCWFMFCGKKVNFNLFLQDNLCDVCRLLVLR